MPVVSVSSESLFQRLGRKYTEKEFDELCFEYGIELDDVIEEEGKEMYKIDIPANRYDLLCLEGLVRALLIFQGKEKMPVFRMIKPSETVRKKTRMVVKETTSVVRPFVVCAILRGIKLDQERYDSLIAVQEQLHRNICRKRTLVAIGAHDLDKIEGPFTYEGLPPEQIKFQHLFADREMEGKEMLDWFRTDPAGKHIKEYTDIIYDSPLYPMILDSNRTTLSMTPIINGVTSKVTLETKNIFFEMAATDLTKANIVLNTMVSMFCQYCEEPNSVEMVEVVYEKPPSQLKHFNSNNPQFTSENSLFYPDMSPRMAEADLTEVREIIGTNLKPAEIIGFCERMQLGPAEVSNNTVKVTVPVTRSDILHACDIIEDIAIAFGYNNITRLVPLSHCPGGELKINALSDAVRHDLARFGYTELMSFALCSHDENFKYLNRVDNGTEAAILANPKTIEFQVVRTSLLPGALKTLGENKALKFSDGIKLFEVTDVVKLCNEKNFSKADLSDEQVDIGCKNERHVVCLYAGPTAGVEIIHGAVDRLMQSLAVIPAKEYCPEAFENPFAQNLMQNDAHFGEYKVVGGEGEGTFFKGMWANLLVKKKGEKEYRNIGEFGALHPTVLENFKLSLPCSVMEVNLEPFV